MARPAIAAGELLAAMETIADFGTVSFFPVRTFATGLSQSWLNMADRVAAAQLSLGLLAYAVPRGLIAVGLLVPFAAFDTALDAWMQAFRLASDERLDGAAVPSLVLVGIGILPVILLCRRVGRSDT